MTQHYTPVAWQDETTSQQGTLINAERLNQMQTAHHYADGFEEVDAVPTADPSVAYHKVVYCTADSTFYRWDGTEWTKDIDDETKALLQQEIARATQADSQLNQRVDDEHDARVDAEAAIHDRITDEATELAQRITTEASTRYTADTALGTRITNETSARETADTNLAKRITAEATARAEADTALGGRIDTEQARAEAAEQANAQAIANTYTKTEADTLLAGKADTTAVQAVTARVDTLESAVADTYNKAQIDTYLAAKADKATTYTKTETDTLLAGYVTLGTAQTIPGAKTFTGRPLTIRTLASGGYTEVSVKVADNRTDAAHTIGTNTADISLGRIGFFDGSDNFGGYLGMNVSGTGESHLIFVKRTTSGTYSASDVATIATLDGYLPMVRTSGNQTIGGQKTFTSLIEQAGEWPNLRKKITDVDITTNTTSWQDKGNFNWVDKNNVTIAQLRLLISATNKVSIQAMVRNADGTNKYVMLAEGNN